MAILLVKIFQTIYSKTEKIDIFFIISTKNLLELYFSLYLKKFGTKAEKHKLFTKDFHLLCNSYEVIRNEESLRL